MTRQPRSGLTLVEVLVALLVFAVIGVAAFAMLDQVLRSDRLAGGRLDRLAQMQRAMQVMEIDTMQAIPGSLRPQPDGVEFLRRGTMSRGVDVVSVGYRLSGTTLLREIGPLGADPVQQNLLDGVTGAAWQFHQPGGGWQPAGPADGVELVLTLTAGQSLRRVFVLPQDRAEQP